MQPSVALIHFFRKFTVLIHFMLIMITFVFNIAKLTSIMFILRFRVTGLALSIYQTTRILRKPVLNIEYHIIPIYLCNNWSCNQFLRRNHLIFIHKAKFTVIKHHSTKFGSLIINIITNSIILITIAVLMLTLQNAILRCQFIHFVFKTFLIIKNL